MPISSEQVEKEMANITAKLESTGRAITVEYDYGSDLDSAIAKFGKEVVFAQFEDSVTIAVQAFLRSKMKGEGEKHKTDQQIRDAMKEWKPGNRKAADPVKKRATIVKQVAGMSEADRASLLAELRASMGADASVAKPALVKGPTSRKGKAA